MAGGAVDTVLFGAAPRGVSIRGRPTRVRGQPEIPNPRPPIRYGELNGKKQATGATATITASMIGAGTRADWRQTPPGWQGNGRTYNEARGHLIAKLLGGLGGEPRNLVTLTHRGANAPQMSNFEREAARRARSGEVIEYSSLPLYGGRALPPEAVLLTALGSRGAPSAALIRNPAGRGR
ncbi:MAG: DNA/RNA non-specific endonuclease [Phenylobacterium sp.]